MRAVCLIIYIVLLCSDVLESICPDKIGPLQRIGTTRFYINHEKIRQNFVDFKEATALCQKHNMAMAIVNDIVQMTIVARQLEKLVDTQELKDSWYWLDAKYNDKDEIYVWSRNNEKVQVPAFLYRNPRPVGLGCHISHDNKYHANSSVEQCLTLALPWPGRKEQKEMFYGHQTIIDERPCIGKKTRHAICETSIPECNENRTEPFALKENDIDYFYNGSWIFGDRKYIINWKPRSFKEAEEYCKDIGLSLMEPDANEADLIPFLKLWNRELTVAQFWTGLKYDEQAGHFFNSKKETVKVTRMNFTEEGPQGNQTSTHNNNNIHCVELSWSYEFKTQSPCQDITSSTCTWSFIDTIPANCNNLVGTICEHPDSAFRTIKWDSSYISDVDNALKETALTKDFLYKENDDVLRSKYKQPFGVLYCPKQYRMLRADNNSEPYWTRGLVFTDSVDLNDIYRYDLRESYWVVDQDQFNKTDQSLCTLSEPVNATEDGGKQRQLVQVPCTKFAFYLCERIYGGSKPSPKIVRKSQPMVWKEGPQERVYPLLEPTSIEESAEDDNCKLNQTQRLELAFSLDITWSMRNKFRKFAKSSKQLLTEFSRLYPNSTYALTLNANWDEGAFAKSNFTGGHKDVLHGCYNPIINFTQDSEYFFTKAKEVKTIGGRIKDNAAHAAAFTISDTTLGWSKGNKDEDGTIIKKILVVITDAESITELTKPGDRKPFRGDGSDTCNTSLPVDSEQIRAILENKDINVIGFYENDEQLQHYKKVWFGLLGDRYCADVWNADFLNLVEVIERCSKRVLKCVFEDPEGYNTLGF